jgi:hypothetical protein
LTATRLVDRSAPAHTEYTRLLAEHGLFGLAALFALIIGCMRAMQLAPPGRSRAWAGGLLVWALIYMGYAAMRVAAPGFVLGLILARFGPVLQRKPASQREPAAALPDLAQV